jgi:hypothetical protein
VLLATLVTWAGNLRQVTVRMRCQLCSHTMIPSTGGLCHSPFPLSSTVPPSRGHACTHVKPAHEHPAATLNPYQQEECSTFMSWSRKQDKALSTAGRVAACQVLMSRFSPAGDLRAGYCMVTRRCPGVFRDVTAAEMVQMPGRHHHRLCT